ncbi:MAG: trigger factor [Actinomycetota bacterium]
MKVDVEKLSPTSVKFSITVPHDEMKPHFDAAYKRIATQINIPGFRKGSVPKTVIDQRFGKGAVLEDALNDAIPAAYEEAVRDNGLVPVGRPTVDVTEISEDSHFSFTAEVEVRPEFQLPSYESLKIEVDPVVVDAKIVDEQVDALRTRFATLKPVERNAQNGDLLLIDIKGELDGESIEELNASALSYELGTDGMLPGFDEAVVGAAKDETRSFVFTPEAGEHEGKGVIVSVTVKAVRERELPELNDDFAQLASEFDTVAELRADVEKRMARLKRLEQGYQARERVQDALLNAIDIPLPEKVLEQEIEEHFKDGHGDDEHRAEFIENQRKSLKAQFIFDRIAEAEALSVTEQELSAWLVQQAPRYGMQPQEFADALVQSGGVQMAVADVRRAKALEVALKNAQVVDSNGTLINLAELDSDLGLN